MTTELEQATLIAWQHWLETGDKRAYDAEIDTALADYKARTPGWAKDRKTLWGV